MWYCFIIFVLACALTFFFAPVTKMLANKYGAIDLPDGVRKKHKSDTPRLGGIAIIFSFSILAFFSSLVVSGEVNYSIVIICLCAALVCVIGAIDDMINLPAWIKVVFELVVATIATLWAGAIEYVFVFDNVIKLGGWGIVVTIIWYFVVMNAINLIDGLDGLAATVVIIMSASILVIAVIQGNIQTAIITASLIGALVGFLPYNLGKNNIFMGDSGSLSIGFVLAAVSVLDLFKSVVLISALTPAIVFALPVFDMISVFAQRTVNGQNPFKGDRRHIHYKLVDLGFTSVGAVVAIVIFTLVFAVAAVVSLYDKVIALIITIVMFIAILLLKHAKDWFGISVNGSKSKETTQSTTAKTTTPKTTKKIDNSSTIDEDYE